MTTETVERPDWYRPARGYSWPPFEPGNMAKLSHGARAPRMVAPLADMMLATLEEVAPWTGRRAFESARARRAWAEAQMLLLRVWIDAHGLENPKVERASDLAQKLEGRAIKLRGERTIGLLLTTTFGRNTLPTYDVRLATL